MALDAASIAARAKQLIAEKGAAAAGWLRIVLGIGLVASRKKKGKKKAK